MSCVISFYSVWGWKSVYFDLTSSWWRPLQRKSKYSCPSNAFVLWLAGVKYCIESLVLYLIRPLPYFWHCRNLQRSVGARSWAWRALFYRLFPCWATRTTNLRPISTPRYVTIFKVNILVSCHVVCDYFVFVSCIVWQDCLVFCFCFGTVLRACWFIFYLRLDINFVFQCRWCGAMTSPPSKRGCAR